VTSGAAGSRLRRAHAGSIRDPITAIGEIGGKKSLSLSASGVWVASTRMIRHHQPKHPLIPYHVVFRTENTRISHIIKNIKITRN
jgi:hypothetical protein